MEQAMGLTVPKLYTQTRLPGMGEAAVELKDSGPQTRALCTVQRHCIEEASPGRGGTLFHLMHTHFQNSRGGDYR